MNAALLLSLIAAATPTAAKVSAGSIVIDGETKDWSPIPYVGGFVQHAPASGAAPSEGTRVKFAYDADALYVLVQALDSSPEAIVAQRTRRDESSPSDWVHVWLDTFADRRSAYRFSVNAANVRQDARVFDGGDEDRGWDAVWTSKISIDDAGWTAELEIPFSQVRYDEGPWGLQVRRDLARRGESSYLSPVPSGASRGLEHFTSLDGLDELPSTWSVDVTPYARAGYGDTAVSGTAGVDVAIGVGSALSIDVTINPDFGDIDADPSVLHLSPDELYLAERRPFFIDGRERLDFGLAFGDGDLGNNNLFYSRRIGANASIIGAAKLTAQTTDGWSSGVMDASTGGPELELATDDGRTTDIGNAALLRVERSVGDDTEIGASVSHMLNGEDAARPRHAATAGLDVAHRFGEGFQLIGRLYGSHLSGDAESLDAIQRNSVHGFDRPDADHLELDSGATSLTGWGASMLAGRLDGDHVRGAVGVVLQSPGLDVNDLGYQSGADQQMAFLWGQYRNAKAGAWHRRIQANVNMWGARTFGGELIGVGGNVNGWWTLPDLTKIGLGVSRSFDSLDVRHLRGGPALARPGSWSTWFRVDTDRRRAWALKFRGNYRVRDDDGGYGVGASLTARFTPISSLELSLSPRIDHGVEADGYAGDSSKIGLLSYTSLGLTARVSWAVTSELSLQAYAAPFFSAGGIHGVREVVAPRADSFGARFSPDTTEGSRFVFDEVRSNVVVRWAYAEGSALTFAWSHHQSYEAEDREHLAASDVSSLFGAPSEDRVMLKLAHYFSI